MHDRDSARCVEKPAGTDCTGVTKDRIDQGSANAALPHAGTAKAGTRTPHALRPSGRQIMHGLCRQALAAYAPVAALHFVEHDPGHAAHALALHGDHGIGDVLYDLTLLRRGEHFLDHADADERHC